MTRRDFFGTAAASSNHVAVNIGQAKMTTLELEGQSGVIYTEAMQNRRVQIMHINSIFGDVVAEHVPSLRGQFRP